MDQLKEVLRSLRRVIRATDLHSRHLAKTAGLSTPQILLLQAIQNHATETIGELASEVSLSQATVTSILDRLENRMLIQRERSTIDKRKVHVRLTEAGLEALRHAPMPLQEQFANRFIELEEWEQTMLIACLHRLAFMMDAENIDAAPVLDVGTLAHGMDEPKGDAAPDSGEPPPPGLNS